MLINKNTDPARLAKSTVRAFDAGQDVISFQYRGRSRKPLLQILATAIPLIKAHHPTAEVKMFADPETGELIVACLRSPMSDGFSVAYFPTRSPRKGPSPTPVAR